MIEELKTLKDFEEGCNQTPTCEFCTDGVSTEEELKKNGIVCVDPRVSIKKIKEELIKWEKELLKDQLGRAGAKYTHEESAGARSFIFDFFNFTEEELQ